MQPENGFKVVKGFTVKAKKTKLEKRLTKAEAEALVASITPEVHKGYWKRNRAIIIFLLNTGLRVGEFSKLKLSDVLAVSGSVKGILDVRAEIAKRKKARHVPLNATAQQAVRDLLEGRPEATFEDSLTTRPDGKPLSKRAIQDVVTITALKAGINRLVGAHCLRHTCLSRLYEKTTNIKIVQTVAGHSSSRLTIDLYTHATMDSLADAMKTLDEESEGAHGDTKQVS